MKFKKKKTYQTLFLSDLHFLTHLRVKDKLHQELFSMLDFFYKKEIQFKRIVLLGDIIESWYVNGEKIVKKYPEQLLRLFMRLEKISTPDNEKIFIIGNHDSSHFDLRLPPVIESHLKELGWQIMEHYQTEHFIAFHGHQGQYGRLHWYSGIVFLRVVFFFSGLLPKTYTKVKNHFYARYNFSAPENNQRILRFYQRILMFTDSICKRGNRFIINGHIHRPLIIKDIRIINCGDWVHSQSLLIEKKNSFVLLRYHDNKFKELYPPLKKTKTKHREIL